MLKVFDPRQLAHAPAQELHNGGWAPHADVPARAESILAAIGDTSPPRDFGIDPIRAVHSSDYLDFLQSAHAMWRDAGRAGDAVGYVWPVVGRRPLSLSRIDALLGRFSYDAGTPITSDSWDAAYWGAQTALTALAPLLGGSARSSFALCRPPGHHSGADYLGGYCYLNNAAIAAQAAVDAGAGPVAILDVDYHHGNGTQDIFWARGDVFFASIQRPIIPFSGAMPTSAAQARGRARRSTCRRRAGPISQAIADRWQRRLRRSPRSGRGR
jgi:acetoin utilization deacetylase AcuC-like enzyme